jgi:hypothetical protein
VEGGLLVGELGQVGFDEVRFFHLKSYTSRTSRVFNNASFAFKNTKWSR